MKCRVSQNVQPPDLLEAFEEFDLAPRASRNAPQRLISGPKRARDGPKRSEKGLKSEVKLHFPKPDSSMRMAQAFLQFGSAAARRRAHTKNESCATWSRLWKQHLKGMFKAFSCSFQDV